MKHLPLGFWARFNRDVARDARPGFMLLGELLDGSQRAVAKTWRDGAFTTMFDFPLAFAITDVFCSGKAPARLASALASDAYPDASRVVTLVDNHDLPRLMSSCGGEQARVAQALAFLLTARGVPSLTWGTEVGLPGEREPQNRASMAFVDHPLRQQISAWLDLRAHAPALSEGDTQVLALEEGRAVFARRADVQLALVFVNQRGPWQVKLPAPWAQVSWREARGGAVGVVPPGVTVWLSPVAPLLPSVRFGRPIGERVVTLRGPAGARAVGSVAALGSWDPTHSVALPAQLHLRPGTVVEFKLVREKPGGGWDWDAGDNRALLVPDADVAVELAPR